MTNHLAPPPFQHQSKTIVPINVRGMDIRIEVDIPTDKRSSLATLRFSPLFDGHPMLDLVPKPEKIWLNNGKSSVHPVSNLVWRGLKSRS